MIGYGGRDLASSFRTVRKNTVQIAEDIPENKYDFIAAPGVQSVGDLLRHLISSPMLHEDMHRERRVTTLKGYDFGAIIGRSNAEGKKVGSRADIIARLRSEGERLATWLASLDDKFLSETYTDATGQNPRTRFEGLLSIKEHEMHHRGQLMLIERMIGVVPHLTRQREEHVRQRQAAATATTAR